MPTSSADCGHPLNANLKRQRRLHFYLLLAASLILVLVLRPWLVVNIPLSLRVDMIHDDALFIRLGMSIASGEWLGAFDQYTLAKGPGYPFFLAQASWSGLPVSLAHALFQSLGLMGAGWAVYRLTRSRTLAAAALALLSLNPAAFVDHVQFVIRDQIYWALMLLVASQFVLAFLVPQTRSWWIWHSLALGLVTGWAWLTREEGVLLLPALSLAVLTVAWMQPWNWRGLRPVVARAALATGAFLLVHTAYLTSNWLAYDAFIGVDIKEKNFVSALNALQSIDAGPVQPFIPVSMAALEQAVAASVTARPVLSELFPGRSLYWWEKFGCGLYPTTCGQFAGGWFVWALRDAAAAQRLYASPDAASQGFGAIASEIHAACEVGKIECRQKFINYVPGITNSQLRELPAALFDLSKNVSLVGVSPEGARTRPVEDERSTQIWRFLNYPLHAGWSTDRTWTARGWFYDPQSAEWPTLSITTADGKREFPFVRRNPSPDLETAFGEGADFNRFELRYECPGNVCSLEAARPSMPAIQLALDKERGMNSASGSATLNIDSIKGGASPGADREATVVAESLRKVLTAVFSVISPLVFAAGLAAFFLLTFKVMRKGLEPLWIAALLLWTLALSRTAILGVIHISSFPATGLNYSLPTVYWTWFAALLSIYGEAKIFGERRCSEPTEVPYERRLIFSFLDGRGDSLLGIKQRRLNA